MRYEDQQLRFPPRESAFLSARSCAEINARYDAFERGTLGRNSLRSNADLAATDIGVIHRVSIGLQGAVFWAILLFG